MSSTIKEVKQAKTDLEKDILSIIQNFEAKHDIHVAHISLFEVVSIGEGTKTGNVSISLDM